MIFSTKCCGSVACTVVAYFCVLFAILKLGVVPNSCILSSLLLQCALYHRLGVPKERFRRAPCWIQQ
eukprot:m.98748 g.98748  ORF g.98748 m.98748 type:complete len:67 (+) comp13645_c2_seq1:1099-1299(+)